MSRLSQRCFCVAADSYSERHAFQFLEPVSCSKDEIRQRWVDKERANTNRVHGAVRPRQVQMDQAVGLGQEQVQVLHGKEEI